MARPRPRWRVVLLHPAFGGFLVMLFGAGVVLMMGHASTPGVVLHGLEWATSRESRAKAHPECVWSTAWVSGDETLGFGGVEVDTRDQPYPICCIEPDYSLRLEARCGIAWTTTTSGLFGPTRRTVTVDASHSAYRFGGTAQEAGNDESTLRAFVRDVERAYTRCTGMPVPDGNVLAARTITNRPSPTTPDHDLACGWTVATQRHERVLWTGYLINIAFATMLVWLGLCAREAWREKPWRALLYEAYECLGCGYDRRGLGDGVRCPECGT